MQCLENVERAMTGDGLQICEIFIIRDGQVSNCTSKIALMQHVEVEDKPNDHSLCS